MTYAERLEAGLLKMGFKPATNAYGGKYKVFRRDGDDKLMFVGPAGALRRGRNVSNSMSLGCPSDTRANVPASFYFRVLEAGTPLAAMPDDEKLTARLLA